MKKNTQFSLHTLYLLPALLLTSGLLNADSSRVALFLQADRASEVYFRESLEWAQSYGPEAVANPVDSGVTWMKIAVVDVYLGFVDSTIVGKDLAIPDGTPIRVRPEADAPILAVANTEIVPEVIEDNGDWITVDFSGPVDLFYHLPQESAPLTTAAAATPFVIAEQTPGPLQGQVQSMDVLDEVEAYNHPYPYPSMVPPTDLEPRVNREFSGVLRRNTGFRKWVTPPHPYYLESPEGGVMAYVDLQDALIIGRVERFFDRPVILTGTTRPIQGRSAFLINTRFIREQ